MSRIIFYIFTLELTAIYRCLKTLSKTQNVQTKFLIFFDLLDTLTSIKNKFSDKSIVKKIHQMIYTLNTLNIEVSFVFISGHVGIDRNEEIDKQAKSAIVTSPLDPISVKDIKILLVSIELENYGKIHGPKKHKTNFFNIRKLLNPGNT